LVKKLGFTDIPAHLSTQLFNLHAGLAGAQLSNQSQVAAFKQGLQSSCRQQLPLLFDSRGRSRSAQPLYCQVAMDYANQQGYRIQIFDVDQWRNATPNAQILLCWRVVIKTREP